MKREDEILLASCAYATRGSSIDFKAGARWADNNPKCPWISAEDDFPYNHKCLMRFDDMTKNVLVMTEYGYTKIMFMSKNKNGEWVWYDDEFKIDYWMPIPELY